MPQPALSVSPASWTFSRMPSIESVMVPDTVQLIVLVAGLCARAPALEVMRPAGIAPRRSAQRKRSFQYLRLSASGRSEEHTSELQSLMRISYAVFCLQKKIDTKHTHVT